MLNAVLIEFILCPLEISTTNIEQLYVLFILTSGFIYVIVMYSDAVDDDRSMRKGRHVFTRELTPVKTYISVKKKLLKIRNTIHIEVFIAIYLFTPYHVDSVVIYICVNRV